MASYILALLFAFGFVLVVGLVFAGLGGVLLTGIVGFRVFSVEELRGWYTKSVSMGARWFLQLLFIVPGMMVGVLGCYVYEWMFRSNLSFACILIMGISAGCLGGFAAGTAAFYLLRKMMRPL